MTEPDRRGSAGSSAPLAFGLVILTSLLVVYWLVATRPSGDGPSHPSAGTALPLLELDPLVNTSANLSLPDLAGSVVFVNYWGPWCPPCRVEMPHLVELQKSLAGESDFRFVSVSCGIGGAYADEAELRNATAAFAYQEGLEFPIHADPLSRSREALMEATGESMGYPTSVLLDRNLTIRGFWQGYEKGLEAEFLGTISDLLSEPK